MKVSSRIGKQQGAQVQNWKEKAARGAGTMFQEFVLNILEKCDEKYNEDMGNAEVKMKILADVIKEQNRKIAELEATVHGHRTQAPCHHCLREFRDRPNPTQCFPWSR